MRLSPREKETYALLSGNQGGGYTEALLGIPSNALKKKVINTVTKSKVSVKSGVVSLMTPTADLFCEGTDFVKFLKKFAGKG